MNRNSQGKEEAQLNNTNVWLHQKFMAHFQHPLLGPEDNIKVRKLPGSRGWLPQHGTGTLRPATRTLWESYARWARRSFAGPHPSLFVPEWHLHSDLCLNYLPVWQCWPCTSPILTFTWFPSLFLDLPHLYGLAGWSGLWLILEYHGASPCPQCMRTLPCQSCCHLSLMLTAPYAQWYSWPHCSLTYSFTTISTDLLKVHFCPWDHLPPFTQAMVPIKLYMVPLPGTKATPRQGWCWFS